MNSCPVANELINFVFVLWNVTREMAPYLLFGFFMAGVLSVAISPRKIESHLGGKGLWPVLKASLFGVPLPLCSCSVIPVGVSLRKHGATAGASTAFIISTPQTGIDSFMVTFSLLGTTMAVFRPVTAFLSGLIGGALVTLFHLKTKKPKEMPKCDDPCCNAIKPKKGILYNVFHYGFVVLPKDLVKSLMVGLVIAGVITAVVPDDFFSGFLGSGITGMFLIMAVSIPVYVCATASVPVALALIAKGVSPGTALVFLMAGPATNAATISAIWNTMGRYSAIIYLSTVGCSAIVSGLVFDYFFTAEAVNHAHHGSHLIPGFVHSISAVVLGAVFVYSCKDNILAKLGRKRKPHTHHYEHKGHSGAKDKDSCSCE